MSTAPPEVSTPDAAAPATSKHRFRGWILVPVITLPLIVLDQVTKTYVSHHMALYQSIPIIPNLLDITYTKNPGAAFSFFLNFPPWFRLAFLMSMATLAIVALLVLIARSPAISLNSVAFSLILAGAAGNLIDRITRGGQVIDFVRAHYYDLNYPIFNVADSAITIGVGLILIGIFFGSDAHAK